MLIGGYAAVHGSIILSAVEWVFCGRGLERRLDLRWPRSSIVRSMCQKVATGFRSFSVIYSLRGEFVLFYSFSGPGIENHGIASLPSRCICRPMGQLLAQGSSGIPA